MPKLKYNIMPELKYNIINTIIAKSHRVSEIKR